MARLSVQQIFQHIASTVNQETTAPTEGGSEWNLWLAFLNRAHFEWAEAHDWEELRGRFVPTITGISQASVGLPADFKKLAGPLQLHFEGGAQPEEIPDILPEQEGLYTVNDKYVEVSGNPGNGYYLLFHPATLASGASLVIPYFSTITSLVSNTQYPQLGDPQYLIDRTIGYILEARSDPRFQLQENKAREKLLQMVEASNAAKYSSYNNPNPVTNTLARRGFRMGRD